MGQGKGTDNKKIQVTTTEFDDLVLSINPAALAKLAGVSRVSVYNWRRGTSQPTKKVRERIKKVYSTLGVKVVF